MVDAPMLGPHFNEELKKSVLFIGTKERGKFVPKATAFVVTIHEGGLGFRSLVTADHVVCALLSKNKEIWIRSNLLDGSARETNWSGTEWWFHPDVGSTDVACAAVDFLEDEDFRALVLGGETSLAGTADVLRSHHINVGHEVFIAGLFRSHYGQQRNIPIIRTGNIATMLGEKVYTKHCNYADAYLIEARR